MITHAADFKEEAATLVKQIQALLANQVRSQDICITARTKHACDHTHQHSMTPELRHLI